MSVDTTRAPCSVSARSLLVSTRNTLSTWFKQFTRTSTLAIKRLADMVILVDAVPMVVDADAVTTYSAPLDDVSIVDTGGVAVTGLPGSSV